MVFRYPTREFTKELSNQFCLSVCQSVSLSSDTLVALPNGLATLPKNAQRSCLMSVCQSLSLSSINFFAGCHNYYCHVQQLYFFAADLC